MTEAVKPVRLTEVKVEVRGPGASEEALKELSGAFPLHTGDVLLHQKYEAAKGELLERARGLGYLDAEFTVHEIHVSPAASTARIHMVLETGPRYLLGQATIEGAQLYPDGLLQRFVAFKPDEPFSYETLGKTQLNFVNSGLFKEVGVFPRKEEAVDGGGRDFEEGLRDFWRERSKGLGVTGEPEG